MPRENSIKGTKMDKKDYGKIATCGLTNTDVVISGYNCNCPCLNCVGCANAERPESCQWRNLREVDPCTNEDIREIMCINCKKLER